MNAPADVSPAIEAALERAGRDLAEATSALEDIRLAMVRIETRLARVNTTFALIASAAGATK